MAELNVFEKLPRPEEFFQVEQQDCEATEAGESQERAEYDEFGDHNEVAMRASCLWQAAHCPQSKVLG